MSLWLIYALTLILLGWFERRWYQTRLKVTGCIHDMQTERLDPYLGETLLLRCSNCGWQCHVMDVKPLPDGAYWHVRSKDDQDYYEQYWSRIDPNSQSGHLKS